MNEVLSLWYLVQKAPDADIELLAFTFLEQLPRLAGLDGFLGQV